MLAEALPGEVKVFGLLPRLQFWTKTLRVCPADNMTQTGATDTLTPGLPV